jgi:hypothetical protein
MNHLRLKVQISCPTKQFDYRVEGKFVGTLSENNRREQDSQFAPGGAVNLQKADTKRAKTC